MINDNNYIKLSKKNKDGVTHKEDSDFFLNNEVGYGWRNAIEERFKALIEAKKEAPYDWYKNLGIDKGDASRIRRGLIVPKEWLRIKIANYFGVDSSVIWKVPEIISADKLNAKAGGTL